MRKVTLTGVIWGRVSSNAELERQHWGCWADLLVQNSGQGLEEMVILPKNCKNGLKCCITLQNIDYIRKKKKQTQPQTLVSWFDKIIDFLDKRNEIDLISHSRVFDKVPRGKLLRQDKYLNSKTREGDGAGHAERQGTGLGRSQQMPLTIGLQPCLGDKGMWWQILLSRWNREASLIHNNNNQHSTWGEQGTS